jgi:hypothetical protein
MQGPLRLVDGNARRIRHLAMISSDERIRLSPPLEERQ